MTRSQAVRLRNIELKNIIAYLKTLLEKNYSSLFNAHIKNAIHDVEQAADTEE